MSATDSDIVRARNKKGILVYKGQTPKGIEFLGKVIGGPWQMAKDIFVECLGEDTIAKKAAEEGVTVKTWEPPKPKPVDVSKYTDF
jgi:hypothetical protein